MGALAKAIQMGNKSSCFIYILNLYSVVCQLCLGKARKFLNSKKKLLMNTYINK